MPLPVRSIRLEKRSSSSLDTLSGESGEIFFDAGQNTLRIYTANQSSAIIIADRQWVQENTFDGDYVNLTNTPTLVTDYSQLTGTPTLATVATTGSYDDLVDAPDLGALNVDISTINSIGDVDTETNPLANGQLLQWDGTNWVNTTVTGFSDTNTTYTISNQASANGAEVVLTDSNSIISATEIIGGSNITVGINLSGQIEVSATLPSVSQLSDTSISNVQDGQLLGYNSGQWINVAAPQAQGGIELTDLSATTATASGSGSLSYDSGLGVFTFTPPNLSAYATTSSFSVTTNTASGGGSLSYTGGIFTFRPALVDNFIALDDLSVVSNAASGNGTLTYSNTTGQFTFTPPDLSGAGGGINSVVEDVTPTLGGTLDAASNDITNVRTITATTYANAGTGAPNITSASTITLTAPDGIITEGLVLSGIASPNSGTVNQQVMDCDCANSSLFIFANNTFGADYSVNFTNVPSLSEQFFRATVLDFSATGFGPTEVRINGTAITSSYPGGSGGVTFTGPNKTEFIIYRSGGTYIALGTVTENYST